MFNREIVDKLSKIGRLSESQKKSARRDGVESIARKGRVEKQGREVRMWKGFEGVIRGKDYYERVSERLERKKH